MKEKESSNKKDKNPYKIALYIAIGIIVIVGGYFLINALQNNAFQQGVQQGAITAESNVVQRINTQQEVPLIIGQEGNQSVQWVGMGDVCTAMIQQQQQAAAQGTQTAPAPENTQ